MNFCVTDGASVVATRYVSSRNDAAASLVCALRHFSDQGSVNLCSGFLRVRLSVNMQKAGITRCPRQTSAKTSSWSVLIRVVERPLTDVFSDRKRAPYLRKRYLLGSSKRCVPLTLRLADWMEIKTNHMIVVTAKMNVLLIPIVDKFYVPPSDPAAQPRDIDLAVAKGYYSHPKQLQHT